MRSNRNWIGCTVHLYILMSNLATLLPAIQPLAAREWEMTLFNIFLLCTVNSLHSGNCGDLELMSSLTRVRNSGSLFQSINVCNWFFSGFSVCPYYRGVRYSGVSTRRELTVYDNVGSVMSSMIPFSEMHGSPAFASQIKENGVLLVVLTPYGSAFSVSVIVSGQQFIWPMSQNMTGVVSCIIWHASWQPINRLSTQVWM